MNWTPQKIAKHIDLAVLKPYHRWIDVDEFCYKACDWGCASICVKPPYVSRTAAILQDLPISVGTVIGFPHGGFSRESKRYECLEALGQGATELDAVLTVSSILSRDWGAVRAELEMYAGLPAGVVKVILETGYLTRVQIRHTCELAATIGGRIAFVKTSTGYGPRGASLADVKTMISACKGRLGVKASGGIRRLFEAKAFLNAGCTRLGVGSLEFLYEDTPNLGDVQ